MLRPAPDLLDGVAQPVGIPQVLQSRLPTGAQLALVQGVQRIALNLARPSLRWSAR